MRRCSCSADTPKKSWRAKATPLRRQKHPTLREQQRREVWGPNGSFINCWRQKVTASRETKCCDCVAKNLRKGEIATEGACSPLLGNCGLSSCCLAHSSR